MWTFWVENEGLHAGVDQVANPSFTIDHFPNLSVAATFGVRCQPQLTTPKVPGCYGEVLRLGLVILVDVWRGTNLNSDVH